MSARRDSKPAAPGVTPMMAQYLGVKAEAGPDALLFYRMGDFYELFFEDAEKAAAALDIALTKRGKHLGEDVPMCGVPVATAETYLARLIGAGFRVAVCEQLEDPAEARKRGPKEPVSRGVVRLVTPGTITEDTLLDARAPAYLAALGPFRDGEAGLAWADVSTGEFALTRVAEPALAEELASLAPREVLVAGRGALGEEAQGALDRVGGALTPWPAAKFDPAAAARRLREVFAVDALDGFGDFDAAEIGAAGALAAYLELTQAGAPARLGPPRRAGDSPVMAIDPATRASLELERTLTGSRRGALLAAIDRTVSGPGARALAGRLARPLVDPAAIDARLDAVAFFVDEAKLRSDVRRRLKAAGDPARALSRLLLGRGGPRDLAAVAAAVRAGEGIGAALAAGGAEPPTLTGAALAAVSLADKPSLAALAQDLETALAPDPPLLARDGGFIASGVDPALDAARKLRDDSRRVIARLQGRYADDAGVPTLKVKHNHQLGYFVEVTARHAERMLAAPLNETFIHRQTMANAVRFSTAELSRLEAEIAGAAERARAVELERFEAFLERVRADAEAIRAAAAALAALDADAGLAEWAEEARAARPVVDDSGAFEVEAGRHPVVEAALAATGERFTPNDCRLDAAGEAGPRLALVTGPNMAGKSTFLRQNALIAILAQAGSFVPAARARLGVADRVFSRVGAADDLARGRSTFMAEMIETAAILNQAGPRALVILDEIGRGTATYDGLAIAWAAAEHLYEKNGARALFATHYHELTRLADQLPAAANLSLRAKEWKGALVFLHEVAAGPADRSYGVEVARRAGLPRAVVARARAVLARLEAEGGGPGAALGDLPLFAAAPEAEDDPAPDDHPVLHALARTDVDALAPRDALALLYELKQLLEPA